MNKIEKITTRVISVNTDDLSVIESLYDKDTNKTYNDRRKYTEHIVENFDQKNFQLHIFDAITPKDFTMHGDYVRYLNNRYPIRTDFKSKYIMANFLSHWDIWNLDEDTLIFEDDVDWEGIKWDNLYATIQRFKEIDNDKKLLYLQRTASLTMQPKIIQGTNFNNYFIMPVVNLDLLGTAAYFVDKKCKEILTKIYIRFFTTDGYLIELYKDDKIVYFYPLDTYSSIDLDKNFA